ncbi:c-type cytochrome [Kistimonas asteriae]|uniref:c-type cytochrome n=1 Tax=Kistimonas asteriae TaxID=517724 RepID=UPI001BA839CF|nr:c-type cytochrome [Kistimonas asteriae]
MKILTRSVLLIAAGLMSQAAVAGQTPESVYQKACKICHDTGVAAAPRKGNAADWEARLQLPMETLVNSVVQGKGAMPPKGMCMDCTAEDYEAVIRYMSGQ